MNVATLPKQQSITGVKNDETPLAFAGQRASLTPQADTVSFSSHTQTQPQFGANKWLLTLAAPFLPLLFTNCDRPEPGDEPTPIDMPTDPFSAGWPYQTDKDLRNQVGVAVTEGGLLAEQTEYPYEMGYFDDPQLINDLEADWDDNNVPESLRIQLRERLASSDFQSETCLNNPDMARMLLGAYTDGVGADNSSINAKLDRGTSGNAHWAWDTDGSPTGWPNVSIDGDADATTFRNIGGNPERDLTLINRGVYDGSDPSTAFRMIEREIEEHDYGNRTSNDMAQAIGDDLKILRVIKGYNDFSAEQDNSLSGIRWKNIIFSVGLNGFRSTPEREAILGDDFFLSPGSRTANNGVNFADEFSERSYPNLDPNLVYVPTQQELDDFEAIVGAQPVNGVFDSAARAQVGQAIEDFIDNEEGFIDKMVTEAGPIRSSQ